MAGLVAMQHSTSIHPRDWGLLVILSILWGGSYLFGGIAVKELPPLVIVFTRVLIAAVALLPVQLLIHGGLPRDRRSWISFGVMSILNNVIPFTLIVSGQTFVTSGLASVVNATTPLFGIAILAGFGTERLNPQKVVGMVAGLGGVVILSDPGFELSSNQMPGVVFCLGAAASYGFASWWAKTRLAGIAPLTSATCQLLCSSAILLPLVLIFSDLRSLSGITTTTAAALLGFALLSTALAYVLFYRILNRSGPSAVMLVTMMVPVSAIAMGYVFLGEKLDSRELAGAAIIIASLIVIDGRVLRHFNHRQAS